LLSLCVFHRLVAIEKQNSKDHRPLKFIVRHSVKPEEEDEEEVAAIGRDSKDGGVATTGKSCTLRASSEEKKS
jgi:hypothetical protein